MRTGAADIESIGPGPFLARRPSHETLEREPGAPCVQGVRDAETSTLSVDSHNHGRVRDDNREPADRHLSIPAGYDESLGADGAQVRSHEHGHGTPLCNDSAAAADNDNDDESGGWVSDGEGHPEQARIAPCTFARWAAGCAAAAARPTVPPRQRRRRRRRHDEPATIPARSSSLRHTPPEPERPPPPPPPPPPLPAGGGGGGGTAPAPALLLLPSGAEAAEAVREIGALRRTLERLVWEKRLLRGDIRALRREREELEAKMQRRVRQHG
ncbi:hypothetical protein VTH06DRAFT_1052 [Thermothelomyces fergusii]